MKDATQIAESIERFRLSFWARNGGLRPPVGVVPARTWLPIGYLRGPFERAYVTAADVTPALARTDYEDGSIERQVFSDDWLPYSAPWRAVPWLEAMCGCPVRYAAGALAPEACVDHSAALAERELPFDPAWSARLAAETARLERELPGDCLASPTILRGPSDVVAAARGLSNFYLDLVDDPAGVARAAQAANRLLCDVFDSHVAMVPPRLGGYGHIYGYWAPGPTNVLQEDVLGMCRPAVYRDLFQPLNAAAVARMGPHTLFHLHSTGLRHWSDVLGVPGLAGLEITIESNGPRLADLLPILRTVLERSRLMLFVDAWFEDLPEVLCRVPHDGLYLIISDRFINTEEVFRAFCAANLKYS
ncbi:MAG TPA: hypothetical protein VGA61_18230 [Anaerolineae bacterium]